MLKDQIRLDLNRSLRDHDERRTIALRMLLTAISNEEIKLKVPSLEDAAILGIVRNQIKQRNDSVTQYRAGNREDLAALEVAEIVALQAYLPPQLSREDLEAEVEKAIVAASAKGPKDMGAVMRACADLKARVDGKELSEVVRSKLAKLAGL